MGTILNSFVANALRFPILGKNEDSPSLFANRAEQAFVESNPYYRISLVLSALILAFLPLAAFGFISVAIGASIPGFGVAGLALLGLAGSGIFADPMNQAVMAIVSKF